jgi:hypothetical protein
MYTPSRATIYEYESFSPPAGQRAHIVTADVTAYGYPAEAVAVELLLGCRSWGDGGYVAAYDGNEMSLDRIAVYPTALMRNQWVFGRARVELDDSSFLLRIRPAGNPIEVIAVLKGYYVSSG